LKLFSFAQGMWEYIKTQPSRILFVSSSRAVLIFPLSVPLLLAFSPFLLPLQSNWSVANTAADSYSDDA
jgi:hypothetical protein